LSSQSSSSSSSSQSSDSSSESTENALASIYLEGFGESAVNGTWGRFLNAGGKPQYTDTGDVGYNYLLQWNGTSWLLYNVNDDLLYSSAELFGTYTIETGAAPAGIVANAEQSSSSSHSSSSLSSLSSQSSESSSLSSGVVSETSSQSSSQSGIERLYVSGAGEALVNGTYYWREDVGAYCKDGEFPMPIIYNTGTAWVFYRAVGEVVYNGSDAVHAWESTWTVGEFGTLPVPTITDGDVLESESSSSSSSLSSGV
jgi:hypothetical protein